MRRKVLCLSALLIFSAQEKPDPELPPDLTHVRKTGYTVNCDTISILRADIKKTEDEHVCSIDAKVTFTDDREPWTKTILRDLRDSDGDKAVSRCVEIGNAWRAKINKAILADQAKHGPFPHPKK